MMIRKEKAEFLDNLLKLFNEVRVFRKRDLEEKCKGDTYLFVQTEKHLKILEKDGMIRCNILDEYWLEPKGRNTLNDLENRGYVSMHKIEAAEWERFEEDEDYEEEILPPLFDLLFHLKLLTANS